MAKKEAPAKLTGGSGFNYEDDVAGRFLVDMLAGIYPLGHQFGRVVRIDWQVPDSGRLLDYLALTLDSTNGQCTAEISVKSDPQVTESGFPKKFVEAT